MKRGYEAGILGVLAIPGLAVMAPGAARAQVDTARVVGTVADATGAVVPNAQIKLHNPATGADRSATTNGKGEYQFLALPPANYLETVEAPGFAGFKQNVTLDVGANSTIDVKLSTASSATTVEVQGGSDTLQVNTTTPEISQVITPQEILNFPSLTRNPYDFVALTGNVSADTGGSTQNGVGVSLSGQRAAGTEILLDGVENEDNYNGVTGQNIPLDSVQEYRIITSGFDAQYGRASGGIVNLVTKSGSNALHGSAYEYNRISDLASNTWNEDAENYALRQAGQPENAPDHFTRNQFGYAVGGPIFKDKLFFFSNTEWTRIRSAGREQFEIPTASFLASASPATQAFFAQYGKLDPQTIVGAPVPVQGFAAAPLETVNKIASINAGAGTPQNTWSTLERFDYLANPKVSMYFRAADYSEVDSAGTVSLSPYQGFDTGTTFFDQSYLYNLDVVVSSNFLANSKVSYSRQNLQQPLNGAPTPTLYLGSDALPDATTGVNIVLPGYNPTASNDTLPFGGPSNVYQFQENLTYTHKAHTFTFGGEFFQLRDNRTYAVGETASENISKSGTAYGAALSQLQAGNVYEFEVAVNPQGKFPCALNINGTINQTSACTLNLPASSPDFERENTFNDGSWYVQDSYKVTPRFTTTLGLRWEYYGVQHNHNPNLESNYYFGSGSNQAVQVANGQVLTTPNSPTHGLIAKDFKNYAPRVGIAWDPAGNGKWSVRSGFGISYERDYGNVTFNVIQNPPNYANVSLISTASMQNTVQTNNFGPFAGASGNVPLPPSELRGLQQNMPTAYTETWLLAVEHQLTKGDLVSVEYTGAHGVHQYGIADVNGIGYGIFNGQTNPNAYGLNRLNPQYAAINEREANGSSAYDGLNVRYQSNQYQHLGLQLTVNYTLSHTLDNLSSTFSESGNNFNLGYTNAFNPALDYGNADYDVRHRVAIGADYQPRWLDIRSNAVAHALLGGLEFAPIAILRTGTPFSIFDCTNTSGTACPKIQYAQGLATHNSIGANTGVNNFNYVNVPLSTANPYVNAEGYSDLPNSFGGSQDIGMGRNQFYGPNNVSVNLGAYKNFHFGRADRYDLQFRAEFYNVLNHSNYYPELENADLSLLRSSATPGATSVNLQAEKGVSGGGSVYTNVIPSGTSPSSLDERRNTQLAVRLQF